MTSSPLRPSPRVTPGSLRAWTLAARPKTLTGAAIPVITASALAWADGVFSLRPALVCLLFACLNRAYSRLSSRTSGLSSECMRSA